MDLLALPQDWSWWTTAGVGAVVGGMYLLSDRRDMVQYGARKIHNTSFQNGVLVCNGLGTEYAFAAPISLWWWGSLHGQEKLAEASFTSVEAGLWTSGMVRMLKFAVGRKRPQGRSAASDPQTGDQFHPFSREPFDAFPSGHTSVAFALVVPYVVYYPGWKTWPLLLLASGTAMARLSWNKHWSTDVAGGALLGAATGYYLSRRHLRLQRAHKASPARLAVLPIWEGGRVGAEAMLSL